MGNRNSTNNPNNQNNNDTFWRDLAVGVGVAVVAGGAIAYVASEGAAGNTNAQSALECLDDEDRIQYESGRYEKPSNLNALLGDIYKQFVVINRNEFKLYYRVSNEVFDQIKLKMNEVDKYFNKYSSKIQYAGSHYDGLRIGRPDEFDIDIVIGMPANFKIDRWNPNDSDINIEAKSPGYVQLRMGSQFQNMPNRDPEDWAINRIAYNWMDEDKYLLRSKFQYWFKGVVNKAMNKFPKIDNNVYMVIDGIVYNVRVSESGPAITLIIESSGFRCDMDLVPAIMFPENRWPIGSDYQKIPEGCSKPQWMVVPKVSKEATTAVDKERSWRVALHEQERELMYKRERLKQSIRLIKKLRDAQNMHEIHSYYIKTIFYQEVLNDKYIWKSSDAVLFKKMVNVLLTAVKNGKIAYFWQKDNNLIGDVPQERLNEFKRKLTRLSDILNDDGSYLRVAEFLLTTEEYSKYTSYWYP